MGYLSVDAFALVVSIAYCTAIVGVGELVRKLRGYGDEFTRKLVHIAIGLWIIPTLFLFTKWYWAAALPALAVVTNLLSLRFNLLRGIERPDKSDLGTVYFPFSFVLCIVLFFRSSDPSAANGFFPYSEAAAVGIIIMALGDASAAIVGKRFGRHPYTFLGAAKSFEGSAAMLVVSAVAAFAVFLLFRVPPLPAAASAVLLAAVATFLEAAGKHGLDNLSVPVVCSILAYRLVPLLRNLYIRFGGSMPL